MRNAINFTWKDAFLKHKDAAELDRNTKILIKRIWRMGREMKTAQLDAIKKMWEWAYFHSHKVSAVDASNSTM